MREELFCPVHVAVPDTRLPLMPDRHGQQIADAHRLEIVGRFLWRGFREILKYLVVDRQLALGLSEPHGGGGEALGE